MKVREFKAVPEKCMICATLADAMKSFKNNNYRQDITRIHAYHKSMCMGERIEYGKRGQLAERSPAEYLYIISDGMAQIQLPWYGNNLTAFAGFAESCEGIQRL